MEIVTYYRVAYGADVHIFYFDFHLEQFLFFSLRKTVKLYKTTDKRTSNYISQITCGFDKLSTLSSILVTFGRRLC